MRSAPSLDPRDVVVRDWDASVTEEEVAFGRELARLELEELLASLPGLDDPSWGVEADIAGLCWYDDGDVPGDRDGDGDGDGDGIPAGGVGPSDADVLDAMTGPVHAVDLLALDSIDVAGLDHPALKVAYLAAVDRVGAYVAAAKAEALVALAGPRPSSASLDDSHAATEVSLALRVGPGAASGAIELARALASTFPGFAAALRAGEVSEWHCRELVAATRGVRDPEVLAAIEARVLPRAKRLTPAKLRTEIAKAVAVLDTDTSARLDAAKADRHVSCRALPDGMGFLGLVHDWATISAMHASVTTDGRALQLQRGGTAALRAGDGDAAADACHADAFAARVLGRVAEDGSVVWDRSEQVVSLTVVMDLDTLRGEADHPALLDGEPVPAQTARQVAETATLWRRAVTAPVTGHLLDYGTEQYLPDALRRFVVARDRYCRIPGCPTKAATRLQMDHATAFPDGPTSAANCGSLCVRHHQLKTAGHLHLTGSDTDGSATLTTRWGQRVEIPPRAFLHDPQDLTDDPPAATGTGSGPEHAPRPQVPPPDLEPPPF